MPRKVQSSGKTTQGRRTSERRAMGAATGPRGRRARSASEVLDGGKWAGSGKKTVERSQGPEIARQAQTGRGAKTRTVRRTDNANHPNKG